MVPASNTPPLKTPKQKLSYRDILKISQSLLSEREDMKQALLNKNSPPIPSYQSPRQLAQPQMKTPTSSVSSSQTNQSMITTPPHPTKMSEILSKLQSMEQRSINDNHQFCQAFLSMGNSLNNMQASITDHSKIIQVLYQNTLGSNGQPLFPSNIIEKLNLPPISPNIKLIQSPTSTRTQDQQTLLISTLMDSSHSNLKNELEKETTTRNTPFSLPDQEEMQVETSKTHD